MWGIDLRSLLENVTLVTVIAGILATVALLLREFVIPQYIERSRQKQELSAIYHKYSAPLRLSANDLVYRIFSILEDTPASYLKANVLESTNSSLSNKVNHDDPYFKKYKFVSTMYRFCAFLGWLELYRQETIYLHPANEKHIRRLAETTDSIKSVLADGMVKSTSTWYTPFERAFVKAFDSAHQSNGEIYHRRDALIYREEVRAIGEAMIIPHNEGRSVMGYAHFTKLFENGDQDSLDRWIGCVVNLFVDLAPASIDFRYVRLQYLAIDLVNLIAGVGKEPVDTRLLNRQVKFESELKLPQ